MLELFTRYPSLRMLILGLLFVAVVSLSYAAAAALGGRDRARRRIAEAGGTVSVSDGDPRLPSLRAYAGESRWARMIDTLERRGLSLADTKDDSLRGRLIAAGYTAPYAPRLYTLLRLGMVIGLPLLVLGSLWLGKESPGILRLYVEFVLAALAGLYLPALFIRAKADRRREELVRSFPDALDLMLVCVEGGLGLEAAFGRVGMELTHAHPLLSEQFGEVVLELRAGRSREDALRRLADRTNVDEVRAFATLLIQSTKLGTSIGQTLRTYAAEMREKRRMRAEEKAHRLPVLLSIPLVACMLPVMIGVLMLPAVIRVLRSVVPALAG